jgi:hypothetical protein
MAEIDWDILQGGDAGITHDAFQHSNVPVSIPLTHDVWARRLDNPGGAGYGRMLMLYGTGAPSYSSFDTSKDVSVRGAMCLGVRSSNETNIGLGVRLDGVVPTTPGVNGNISTNGYVLKMFENGAGWRVALDRITAGANTQLWSHTLGTGAVGTYKWFHLRLDFLLQPNGDAALQVFQNDLSAYPIQPASPPAWGAFWVKIGEVSELAVNVPDFARIGWGGQVNPGAGGVYESYMDWTEVWHS